MKWTTTCAALTLAGLAQVTFAGTIDPWSFSVVSMKDIGSANAKYGSDFEGSAAVLGSAYFSGFSLHSQPNTGPNTGISIYAGKDVLLSGGSIYNGGVEAGRNVHFESAAVYGNVRAGGNLTSGWGTIYGSVAVAGSSTGPISITGPVSTNAPFTPTLDLQGLGNYFTYASNYYDSLMATDSASRLWSAMNINLQGGGLHVVDLSSSILKNGSSISEIKISGPSDAQLIVNIDGQALDMRYITWQYSGGLSQNNVLVNMHDMLNLTMTGGDYNLLAPYADTTYWSGALYGNLVVGNLKGAGEVETRKGFFKGTPLPPIDPPAVPEPATVGLLVAGVSALLLMRRRPHH